MMLLRFDIEFNIDDKLATVVAASRKYRAIYIRPGLPFMELHWLVCRAVLYIEWGTEHAPEFHQLDDGGINPRPKSGKVPIWFGGHAEATFRRTAKYGDGFMPLAYPAGDDALKAFDKLRTMIRAAGRDPASVGLEVWASPGIGKEEDWRREISFWKKAGVTHVNAHTSYVSAHHKRIAGKSYADHLDAITRYRAAVADLL